MSKEQLLARIREPRDLKRLHRAELVQLAEEIRQFLVQKVAVTGGHLGPNLGVVELTIALHRIFDSPADPLIFDTGHQAYVHKILTGRKDQFDTLRKQGGLSGYPSRSESAHDWVESSHASASLSYADGMAKAFALTGQDRHVVAVVGDGALTGGMCWEALNNIAAAPDRPVVVVVNDNGRSYAPTIGGLADRLTALRTQPAYLRFADAIKQLEQIPVLGGPAYPLLHAIKTGVRDAMNPQALFSDLDIEYVGPVDGHDLQALELALWRAKDFGGTVLVHIVTSKGMGYAPAENQLDDQMHAPGPFDPLSGRAVMAPAGQSWTSLFAAEMVRHGEQRDDIVAITAAMPGPTGLSAFAERFPDRMFDVGIAEQHAVTSAAGLALGGVHPVVTIYSTFLNRAFDQVLMDVALLRLPVTLVLDRAGVTGPDGPSHHGVWDLALLSIVPGMRVAAPRDAATLREELTEALATTAPTALRFPKGRVVAEIAAVDQIDGIDVLVVPESGCAADVLVVAVGAMAGVAVEAAAILTHQGIRVRVVDPRWVLPVPDALTKLADQAGVVVTIEDGIDNGGISASVARHLAEANIDTPVRGIGVPTRFLEHASRDELLHSLGLDPTGIAHRIAAWLTGPHVAEPTP
ncbi:1-deoxy-D-xylulose-5-phosphate synthase [Nocardia pseudovaccinii]|uniref:1-deoxy-D-xylulose-5-phosphate synthase n=1 Tax=Nocardia pseudovaccinii TaxID=189540 RepID=UPI001FE1575C|nr:1-deoxy-D-xylulose-5-phosphate synthase [Nocardia pseudovaccinii]